MHLTLIKPNLGQMEDGPYVDEGRMEPLQLGLLAALCPPDVEVSLVDDRCEAIPYDTPTDLAAITVETFTARRAYEIGREYRRRGVRVVLGGFHPTLAPDEAAANADAIVTGDAESVWRDVLADARTGALRPIYRGAAGVPQQGVRPRRDLFRGKGYLPITLTQFGRGCANACDYCAVGAYFSRTHRCRPVEAVVREIESADPRLVFFVDDNLVADPAAAKALFRALAPLGIRWVSQGTIDMTHDAELMDLMCASGCLGHVIGFETLSRAALQAAGKAVNLGCSPGYEKEIAVLRRYGLQTWAAFMVGHDEDTSESLYATLDFARRHKFTFAAFNIVMPYPGTPLYARLRAEGRLLYDGRWWTHPDYRFNRAAFQPKRMSPEELTDVAFDLRRRWSRPACILQRFLDPATNMGSLYRMGIYWAYNPLFRREMFRKQGLRLGTG
jgi:radical SAM superfamily enzyme YgiQ (UPF0313 family)